jgi:hypothetical protein
MSTDDRNADLIGHEFTDDSGVTWRVIGTDVCCGPNYVQLNDTSKGGGSRIQVASVVRRAKQIEDEQAKADERLDKGILFEGPS